MVLAFKAISYQPFWTYESAKKEAVDQILQNLSESTLLSFATQLQKSFKNQLLKFAENEITKLDASLAKAQLSFVESSAIKAGTGIAEKIQKESWE